MIVNLACSVSGRTVAMMPPELAATIVGRTGKSEAVVICERLISYVHKLPNVKVGMSTIIISDKGSNEKVCLHLESEEEANCS
jgi:hypothetical protein